MLPCLFILHWTQRSSHAWPTITEHNGTIVRPEGSTEQDVPCLAAESQQE